VLVRTRPLRYVVSLICLSACGEADRPSATAPAAPSPPPSPTITTPVNVPVSDWDAGMIDPASLPPRSTLKPLPGGASGNPVVTSNNPEVFRGNGTLFGTHSASPSRGGGRLALSGPFGFYVHHLNRSDRTKTLSLVVKNDGNADAVVTFFGSGYTQTETGGVGLGTSPDARVSAEWIQGLHAVRLDGITVRPGEVRILWSRRVAVGAEIDGRFGAQSSAPIAAAVVVTDGETQAEALAALNADADGDIARSGTPPPPFGREAGVYSHDSWVGTIHAAVPAGPRRVGLWVNTATGGGASQVQAFPALLSYHDSAREAVGMYGNVYDLTIALSHDGADGSTRRVRVLFGSLTTVNISRYWDGYGLVDGRLTVLRHVPGSPVTTLAEVELTRASPTRVVRFRAMVPGLTSIPQALWLESR
jgi:hypothetical protein